MVLILGVLVGLVLGLTGAGGGMLAVPALVFGMGWSVAQAAPVALLAVAGGAWMGAIDGLRQGLARYRAALVMALAALPSTTLGLMLAQRLPALMMSVLFACVMVVAAVRILRSPGLVDHEHAVCRVNAGSGRFIWTPRTFMVITGFGLGTGLLTGLLGVGGGFVIVPVLVRYTELSMAAVVATSLMVVALVSSLGLVTAWLQGVHPPLAVALPFLCAVMAGMLAGRLLTRHVSARASQRGFALLMLAVAVVMLGQAGRRALGV